MSTHFTDIATNSDVGIDYRRTPSERNEIFEKLKDQGTLSLDNRGLLRVPIPPRGMPGVAIFDYDNDGDLDIYATNGPGTSNSLLSSQLVETGELTFVDVAEEAGVEATFQDSSGVTYGDIDNDGDHDLYVAGATGNNSLYLNDGDGKFTDITEQSGTGGGGLNSTSAAMGDVNGDGLLDIFVSNYAPLNNREQLFNIPFAISQHNQLFLNQGDGKFTDVSTTSGIEEFAGLPEGAATLTWISSLVDYDQDGDLDIFSADDQALIEIEENGGIDRGYVRVLENDGTGNFEDVSLDVGNDSPAPWMGLDFADFNHDGNLDFFATNVGSYRGAVTAPFSNREPNELASQWSLQQSDGTFIQPGPGDLNATPWGWGTATTDYDNDGDTDIIYHGGMELGAAGVEATNPGIILENDGTGKFTFDEEALANSTNHSTRMVKGMAVGDLNQDGFTDIISASNFDVPESVLSPITKDGEPVEFNSPFDDTAYVVETFLPTEDPNVLAYNDTLPAFPDGTLSVEINSADNDNNWVEVELLGTAGITPQGSSNRDGIGAMVSFTPEGGKTALQPILGGSSFLSQNSLAANFGLGEAEKGVVEVIWTGGVRNRFYGLEAGDSLLFPEIPVSFDDPSVSFQEYKAIVDESLDALVDRDLFTSEEVDSFRASAIRAFQEARTPQLIDDDEDGTVIVGEDENTVFGGSGEDTIFIPNNSKNTIVGGIDADRFWITQSDASGTDSEALSSLFVASFNNDSILEYDSNSGEFIKQFDLENLAGLSGPIDPTIDLNGDLLVTSFNTDNVLKYDTETGDFIEEFIPSGSGGLAKTRDLVFGPDNDVYVTSEGTDSVLKYDGETGDFIEEFIPSGSGGLDNPVGLDFGPDDNLYVASNGNDSILKYDGDTGDFIEEFVPSEGSELKEPLGLTFSSDGELFVSSFGTNSVLEFDTFTGDFIEEFVSPGEGGLNGPRGVTFGADEDLYVSSFDTGILRFDGESGTFVDELISSGEGGLDGPVIAAFDPDVVPQESTNTIIDFELGTDVIGIRGSGISFEELTLTQEANNTIIQTPTQTLATLINVQANSLSANDFVFEG